MALKILIIEDEPLVAKNLQLDVISLRPSAEIFGPIGSVKSAIDWLTSNNKPDLILADIQLSDGVSLEIFSHTTFEIPIIFTTAFNEFALRAFKLNSIDYLLKPINKNELEKAFIKYEKWIFGQQPEWINKGLQSLLAHFHEPVNFKERFLVHSGKTQLMIDIAHLLGFTKDELIFLLHTSGEKYLTDYRSLDEIESLINPKTFFRVNRQYLLHIQSIQGFKPDEYGKLHLKVHPSLPNDIWVSKEKASEFKHWLNP